MREATETYRMVWQDSDAISASYQRAALRVIVDEATEEVSRTTPVGPTGNLKNSVQGRVIEHGTQGFVGAKAPHAHLIHDGVQPHETHPKSSDSSRVLRFWDDLGDETFRRTTWHPGLSGRPWVSDGVARTKDRLEPLMRIAGGRVEAEYA